MWIKEPKNGAAASNGNTRMASLTEIPPRTACEFIIMSFGMYIYIKCIKRPKGSDVKNLCFSSSGQVCRCLITTSQDKFLLFV